MDMEKLEEGLSALPLYAYAVIDPKELEFSERIRWICQHECPMYGKTWACPPGVGTVEQCKAHCLSYSKALVVSTVTEVQDIGDIAETLSTRGAHEEVTDTVADLLRGQGIEPFVLSTEACTLCESCAILDGQPCRMPEKMHPCVESQGINIIPVIEKMGLVFQYGENVVTWFSVLLFDETALS